MADPRRAGPSLWFGGNLTALFVTVALFGGSVAPGDPNLVSWGYLLNDAQAFVRRA